MFMRHFLFSLAAFIFSTYVSAADAPTKRVRLNEFYTVIPTATTAQMDIAAWIAANPQQGNHRAESASQLLTHFKSQPAKNLKNGIFVYSSTHSLELTDKEKASAAPRLLDLMNNKVWREAENKLIDALVAASNTEGVPVWVLLRGTGELHTYKLLTDPKLTLKK